MKITLRNTENFQVHELDVELWGLRYDAATLTFAVHDFRCDQWLDATHCHSWPLVPSLLDALRTGWQNEDEYTFQTAHEADALALWLRTEGAAACRRMSNAPG